MIGFPLDGCRVQSGPQAASDEIVRKINHGDLNHALADVNAASKKYGSVSPEWDWRFRVLKAQVLISRSDLKEALWILKEETPASLVSSEIGIRKIIFEGVAHKYSREFDISHDRLAQAERLANASQPQMLCEVLNARGALELTEGRYDSAEATLGQALALARKQKNSRQEASILLNMAVVATNLERFDEAMDRSQAALQLSRSLDMQSLVGTNLGNLGWASYELGDFENALALYKEGAEISERSGLNGYSAYWFNGVANAYMALRDYPDAEVFSKESLRRARSLEDAHTITECLNTLAELSLRTGQIDQADKYNQEAIPLEAKNHDDFGIRESAILSGRIETQRRHFVLAQEHFEQTIHDPKTETALKWEVHARLAELHDLEGFPAKAEQEYQQSIDTIETARDSIDRDDLRLSYLSSGIEFYDDYIDFLVAHGRPEDALRVAELSRARTLTEGLASASQAASVSTRNLRPQLIAQKMKTTLFFYWVGQKQSHLWMIAPTKTTHFVLPKAAEIDPLVKSYREAVLRMRGAEDLENKAGKQLYAMLIGAAKKLIPKDSSITILPDASLSALNFETLVVDDPQPHFWIEDVTLTTASSLTLLAASTAYAAPRETNLLLVGNTVQPNDEFPVLAQAPAEMKMIEGYFPQGRREVLEGAQATPSAYLASHPERFSYLHFVTHGTASVTRPLESAVILSKEGDSYKLYARDIVKRPLTAQLVTISACEGAGKRAYSGEGLVGLSWAFLRAGAHNVVGALWEVSDSSTPQFMDTFYGELGRGKDPASALRAAKLSLLHSADTQSVFKKPYYWAPFQLYAGS
jgi:CHAT domain-containing protein